MCSVSFVSEYYHNKWPTTTGTSVSITKEQWDEYQALKQKALEYDKKTNQQDCIKPELEEWEDKMIKLLIKHGILTKGN